MYIKSTKGYITNIISSALAKFDMNLKSKLQTLSKIKEGTLPFLEESPYGVDRAETIGLLRFLSSRNQYNLYRIYTVYSNQVTKHKKLKFEQIIYMDIIKHVCMCTIEKERVGCGFWI